MSFQKVVKRRFHSQVIDPCFRTVSFQKVVKLTNYVTIYVTMARKCNNLNFNVTKFVTPLKSIKSVV